MASLDINLILDASGSMSGLINDTIGGINDFIAEQKKLPDHAFVTLTTFDTNDQQRYQAVPLADVKTLTRDGYFDGHGGGTALLDAVGKAVAKYEALPVKADKSMFVIVTDGQENASREMNIEAVRATIKRLQDAGTAFVFLGANDSAWQASNFGVAAATTGVYTASATGTRAAYGNLSANTSMVRSSSGTAFNTASASKMRQPFGKQCRRSSKLRARGGSRLSIMRMRSRTSQTSKPSSLDRRASAGIVAVAEVTIRASDTRSRTL